MTLYWRLKTAWSSTVPLPLPVVRSNLQSALDQRTLYGSLDDGGFRIHRTSEQRSRNSWRPILTGTLTPEGSSTHVKIEAAVHPAVLIFTAVHAVFMFGVGWVLGTLAFSLALPSMREAVDRALRGE